MSGTHSINIGTPFETTKLENIFQALQLIPDNTSQLISPKDVRDLVYTAYEEGRALILSSDAILFRQDTPAEVWTIYHTNGRRPSVTVYDDNFYAIEPLIQQPDLETIKVYFNEPITGWVIG
jgi:hypothetical protein